MSDKPYEKNCMYCGEKITMSKETGKWLPYCKDGSDHDCRTNGQKQEQQQGPAKKEYTLDEVRAKLESLGIIINVDRLMAS